MRLIARHIGPLLVEALSQSRVVCVLGARQAGKTTLVRSIAEKEHPARYVSLDDRGARELAQADPVGFLGGEDRLAIDEVQRVPDLLLAIKQVVDADNTRGRFLLTGSANILTHPQIADALPRRVAYLTLWPFSRGELIDSPDSFLESSFAGRVPGVGRAPSAGSGAVVHGGPAARLAHQPRSRSIW